MSIAYILPTLKELISLTPEQASRKRKEYKKSNDKNFPMYGNRLIYSEDFSKASEEYKDKNLWTMKTINGEYEVNDSPEQCDFEINTGVIDVLPRIQGDEEAFGRIFYVCEDGFVKQVWGYKEKKYPFGIIPRYLSMQKPLSFGPFYDSAGCRSFLVKNFDRKLEYQEITRISADTILNPSIKITIDIKD